jgi:hypothetical protein
VSSPRKRGNGKEIEVEHVLEQVGALMALTTALEAQHANAQSTISALECKVVALEAEVRAAQAVPQSSPSSQHAQVEVDVQHDDHEVDQEVGRDSSSPSPTPEQEHEENESLTAVVSEWTKTMEGKWSSVQEDWGKERERLSQAREEWETKARMMDSGLEKLSSLSVALQERERELGMGNGEAVKHGGGSVSSTNAIGLVTPPSPRSLSSDSGRSRRRRRGRNGRGSRSVSPDSDTDVTLASEEAGHEHDHEHEEVVKAKVHAYAYANGHVHGHVQEGDGEREEEEEEEEEDTVLGVRSGMRTGAGKGVRVRGKSIRDGAGALATPESSVYKLEPDHEEVRSVSSGAGAGAVKGGLFSGDTVCVFFLLLVFRWNIYFFF